MKIILDAMGGDNAPDANIKGAVNAINKVKAEVILVGKEEVIRNRVKEIYGKEIEEISDRLKFEAADNPLWTDEGNNVISTKQLENTLLQPGETATVEVILTWINDPNNMGLKTNTAEISQDKNEYDVPDRDSTPDNKKEGEDDIDIAKVILSVTTGTTKTYFSLALGLIAIIGTGIVLIKKYFIE